MKGHQLDLGLDTPPQGPLDLAPGAVVLKGFALDVAPELLALIADIVATSPWRHQVTPGGHRMSVAMTNCGQRGWVTDRRGYRYETQDPLTGRPWPPMPPAFTRLAARAAQAAGYPEPAPDACLVNRYDPGAKMSLHQDKDELDLDAPIVSVSLGLPAIFLFGGPQRPDRPQRVRLHHGDVVVWGGPTRLHYHGVHPVEPGHHPDVGPHRLNLTFRRTGRGQGPTGISHSQ